MQIQKNGTQLYKLCHYLFLFPVFPLSYSPDTLQNFQKIRLEREGCMYTSQQPFSISMGPTGKLERDSSWGTVVIRSNGYTLKEGKLECDIRETFFTVRVVRQPTGCPGRLGMLQPWQCSRPEWKRPWKLCLVASISTHGSRVGPDHL